MTDLTMEEEIARAMHFSWFDEHPDMQYFDEGTDMEKSRFLKQARAAIKVFNRRQALTARDAEIERLATQLAEAQAEIERLREACVALVNIWDANMEDDEPHPVIDSDFVSDLWKDDVIETVRAALNKDKTEGKET